MIRLGDTAERQLNELLDHYARLNRPEASRALIAAIDQAIDQIEGDPTAGLLAPRPYPQLAQPGEAWIKAGRYWVAYTTITPMIIAVFYDAADIPRRR